MKKILVVDDEKDIRDLIKEVLENDKFFVIGAPGGEEALALAKKEKPDLILLDIAMPGMDGYITCGKLKGDAETSKIPVLFLTGKDFDIKSVIERTRKLDAAGYVSKLTSMKELSEHVKEILFRT
jgi:DNA-binding response OmpR family regulator